MKEHKLKKNYLYFFCCGYYIYLIVDPQRLLEL